MDRKLELLKRKASSTNLQEDWDRYIKALERIVGGVDTTNNIMYLSLILPCTSGGSELGPGPQPNASTWTPAEEECNPAHWGVFETDIEAFSYAFTKIKGYGFYEDEENGASIISAIEEKFNEEEPYIDDLVRIYNTEPGLRIEGTYAGTYTAYTPYIYIIPIE
jgi:hypothetical protein